MDHACLLFMFRVCLVFLSFYCIILVTCWERADHMALLYVVFSCVFSLYDVVSWVRCSA